MAEPQDYLVTPTTGIDQSMLELLAQIEEVDPHQIIEKQDADTHKGLLAYWILTLQKKKIIFAMDRCFLLTGAF